MRILVCTDSFKDGADSFAVSEAIRQGIHQSKPDWKVECIPMADGGENSLAVLAKYISGEWITCQTEDPLGRSLTSRYWRYENTAWFELAHSSGLELLGRAERDCTLTSTYGTGLEMKHAIDHGAETLHLFVGGSATNDMGLGIAQALGFRFYDEHGNQLKPIGASLLDIQRYLPLEMLSPELTMAIYTDVDNPLTGPNGAVHTYAEQKGASPEQRIMLEKGMKNFGAFLEKATGRDIISVSGSGAAGGVPGGCIGFFGADITSASQFFFKQLNLTKHIQQADLIITGEGKLDHQSVQGKLIGSLLELCHQEGKPLIALCGALQLSFDTYRSYGLTAAYSIQIGPTDLANALSQTIDNLRQTSSAIAAIIDL